MTDLDYTLEPEENGIDYEIEDDGTPVIEVEVEMIQKGDKGDPALIVSTEVTYQEGDNATDIPTGTWSAIMPAVAPGKYLWQMTVRTWDTGTVEISYLATRYGLNGIGSAWVDNETLFITTV